MLDVCYFVIFGTYIYDTGIPVTVQIVNVQNIQWSQHLLMEFNVGINSHSTFVYFL